MEKICFLFLFLVLLVQYFMPCCFGITTTRTNLTTDQYALLTLKAHITFEPHNAFLANNWSSSTSSCCNWIGVTCGIRHQRVTALNLANLGLNGTIPPHLGNLSFLASINLRNNSFRGHLPDKLVFLHRLKFINLGLNYLSGVVPSWFDILPNLESLHLHNNSFSGTIPPSLCNISKLEYLYLSENQLHGTIPKEIGGLTMLKNLSMSVNHLSGSIPSSIYNMSSLRIINLGDNTLSGSLPTDICSNLPNLELLYLHGNQLNGELPSTLDNCGRLQGLSLSYNKFTGRIPGEIGNLTRLTELFLGFNNFEGKIPQEVGNLQHLEWLSVIGNKLTGSIPATFFNMSSLIQISLYNNSLSGSLPLDMCHHHLPALEKLYINNNNITGSIPRGIGNCTSLMYIYLSDNFLTESLNQAWRRISHHEILQATNEFSESNLLGNGSFGSVYKGILSDGINVAIKVFNLQIEGAFKSFDAECEVLRNIRHRNLIKIISSCSNNLDFKALVIEYMPNGSLEKWLYSHNYFLDILQRLNIMIDVAMALEYLHCDYSTPIVHCDLKPSNILLDGDMVAHVGDFGISKLLVEGELMTQTVTLATVGYMAPEYGSEGIVSTRGDVYSYGILLMETFTRKKPTDEIFVGDISLKEWVKESLPHTITEIADANLLGREEEYFAEKIECISSIMELALECSAQLPEDRIEMKDALTSLSHIKTKLQKRL